MKDPYRYADLENSLESLNVEQEVPVRLSLITHQGEKRKRKRSRYPLTLLSPNEIIIIIIMILIIALKFFVSELEVHV